MPPGPRQGDGLVGGLERANPFELRQRAGRLRRREEQAAHLRVRRRRVGHVRAHDQQLRQGPAPLVAGQEIPGQLESHVIPARRLVHPPQVVEGSLVGADRGPAVVPRRLKAAEREVHLRVLRRRSSGFEQNPARLGGCVCPLQRLGKGEAERHARGVQPRGPPQLEHRAGGVAAAERGLPAGKPCLRVALAPRLIRVRHRSGAHEGDDGDEHEQDQGPGFPVDQGRTGDVVHASIMADAPGRSLTTNECAIVTAP